MLCDVLILWPCQHLLLPGYLHRQLRRTRCSPMNVEHQTIASTLTIPRRATVEGAINFPGPVVIDGTLVGEVRAASLIISERGSLKGSIWAGSVVVMGEVAGDIYAVTLTLKTACSVQGNIFHRHLELEDGCYFEGKSRRHNEPLALIP